MRRMLATCVVSMLVVLLLATPVLAAKQGAPRFFSLTGTITELDAQEEYLTVEVLEGNPLVTQHIDIGDVLEVQVTDSTEIWSCTGTGREYLDYSELETGLVVYIHGTKSSGEFIADRVVVDKPD